MSEEFSSYIKERTSGHPYDAWTEDKLYCARMEAYGAWEYQRKKIDVLRKEIEKLKRENEMLVMAIKKFMKSNERMHAKSMFFEVLNQLEEHG